MWSRMSVDLSMERAALGDQDWLRRTHLGRKGGMGLYRICLNM